MEVVGLEHETSLTVEVRDLEEPSISIFTSCSIVEIQKQAQQSISNKVSIEHTQSHLAWR